MIDREKLHAYVDGELSTDEVLAIRAQLKSSPEEAREVEAIQTLKSLLKAKAEVPEFKQPWKDCVKRLDELDKAKRVESVVGRLAPFMCAALFVGIILVGKFGHHGDRGFVSGPDVSRIFGRLSTVHPPQVDGMKRERWLHSRIVDSFSSTPDHLSLRAEKSGVMQGMPITDFSARDEHGDLEIYVIKQAVTLEGTKPMDNYPDLMVGSFNGVNCVVRPQGDSTILIVAARTYVDLAKVAGQVTIR